MKNVRAWWYIPLFIIAFLCDRVTKYLVLKYITWYPVTSFFSLYLVHNTGISWGIADGLGMSAQIIIMFVVTGMIFLIMQQGRKKMLSGKSIIGEILVCSGAISNLFDRIWYGGVIDFISFQIFDWQAPIFNIADVFIVGGISLILFNEMFYHE
jgi:signal peptidase II